tara:strand:+ start:978 stop:2522 length:1545 start_codon:yes stop_codon:yes gene_type:complete
MTKRLNFIFPLIWIASVAADERPNIFFFFADDWGRHAGVYSDSDHPSISDVLDTPNIDRIGKEGVIFENAFTQVASCGPSRACLSTGRSFWRNGSAVFKGGDHFTKATDPYTTLPKFGDLLRESGYHVDKYWKTITFDVSPGSKPSVEFPMPNAKQFPRYGLHVGSTQSESERQERHDQVVENVGNVMGHHLTEVPEGKPFFFIFGPINTHRPYTPDSGKALWGIEPDDLKGRIPAFLPDVDEVRRDFSDYAGEIQALDLMLGVMLDELERQGELDNTIVILSGDHGMPGVPRGKTTCYDFGVKVPLMVRYPAMIEAGRRVEDFVTLSDLAPTLLELADVEVPDTMDARSFLAQLKSPKSGWIDASRNKVITGRERHVDAARKGALPYPMRSVRTGEYLYIRNFKPERTLYGDVDGGYRDMDASLTKSFILDHAEDEAGEAFFKLHFEEQPGEVLYRVGDDPDSMENLSDNPEYASVMEEMRATLLKTMEKTGDLRLTDEYDEMPWTGPVKERK